MKKSFGAFATGFILALLGSGGFEAYNPYLISLIVAFLAFIIYQGFSFSRYFGNRRGEFEYEYRNDLIEAYVKKLVMKTFGSFTYINYIQDGFNEISSAQEEICTRLQKEDTIKNNYEALFNILIKMNKIALKQDNFEKEKAILFSATKINPNDLIANYRLAVCYEMEGSKDEAIKHYLLATTDSYLTSNQLRKFILSQIKRIELKGTMNRPPVLGAKYLAI